MLAVYPNPTLLYLPLLNDPSPMVRRQAYLLLLSNYGEHAITLLRRLLAVTDDRVQGEARSALKHIAELADIVIKPEPYSGIFIMCLGHCRIFVDNQELHLDHWVRQGARRVGWQKLQSVLSYLVHCGARGTTLAALAAAVWGRRPASTLMRTLNTLRDLLCEVRDGAFAEGALVIADQYCLMRPDIYRTDVQRFEAAFDFALRTDQARGLDAAAPLYHQTLQLYTGPYMIATLQGDDWAQERRDYLRGNFLIAAERVAEHAFVHQRFDECITICNAVFDADESADDVVVWLLRAYERIRALASLEQAYRRYLTANRLNDRSPEAWQDVVVHAYTHINSTKDS